jgi:hypothetical protein
MNKLIIMVISILICSPIAFSEELPQYEGIWKIKMITANGKTRKGVLEISNQGGTWDIEHTNVKDDCKGRSAPIVIKEASADVLVFQVLKSKALKGCNDFTVNLKPVNESILEGESDNGRKITLTKK